MNMRTYLATAALLSCALLTMSSSCPLIPDAEERTIELALTGSTVREFQAEGSDNTYSETDTYDLADELDVAGILDDAGVDLSETESIEITAQGISYRVTVPDPVATRRIENGTATITRGAGVPTPLVIDFDAEAGAVTDWTTAELSPAGITILNGMLQEILLAVKTGSVLPPMPVTYSITGLSVPTGIETNFTWELRLDVSIKGEVTVDIWH